MLVVSRKPNQSVVFPNLGITVEIIRVAGKAVCVGIKAPEDVRVLRGELADVATLPTSPKLPASESANLSAEERHAQRNRLNKANLALKLVQKQLQAGLVADAEESMVIALEALHELERSASSLRTELVNNSFACNPTGSAESTSSPRKKALLVEDDANERALLASYLRAHGYDVDTAEDGQAAIEYLATHKPDAVLMDMEMPRMNGHEAVREIRNDYQLDDVKLFVVSGMEQAAMKVPSGDRGIQRWFQKPLRPEELIQELASFLN